MLRNRLPDSFVTQQGVTFGLILGTPIYTDTSDENNIYLGYCHIDKNLNKSDNVLVCRITINGSVTEKDFAYGEWANREALDYK